MALNKAGQGTGTSQPLSLLSHPPALRSHRGAGRQAAPQNAMGTSATTRQDSLVPTLVSPLPPMALACPCTGGDAEPRLGHTSVQKSEAGWWDEGHSPRDAPAPPRQGTEMSQTQLSHPSKGQRPARARMCRGGVWHCQTECARGKRRRMRRRPRCVRAAPRCSAQPERSRTARPQLINHPARRRDGGPRQPPPIPAPLPQKQPLPCTASKGFVRVPVCAAPSPPSRCCFLCVCTRKRGFFCCVFFLSISLLFPGKLLAPALGSCEKRAQERRTDRRSKRELGEPAMIATRLGGFGKEKGGGREGCGANKSKINIYMGRVLKPYFASL